MKAPIKKYLSITKKEWNGLVVLVIIILAVLGSPYIYQQFHKDSTINFTEFNKAVAVLKQAKDTTYSNDGGLSDDKIDNPVMFKFDPNNLPAQQWKQLGLSDHQVNIIKHFESKGGHFYKKEDLQKIYSITAADYQRLEPYINIAGEEYVSNKVKPGVIIEINSADSVKLTQLHGIGPAFAQRIIAYRERLGGFLNKEQLKEVYGIDSAKYAQIQNEVSVNSVDIVKIKVNEVDFEGLRKFPYLTNKQTNAIIQYRKQHGNYRSITDMRNILLLNDDILAKIEPYIVFK